MSKYKVSEISVRCDDETIQVIRLRIDGGATGTHYTRWIDNEYLCSCLGFARNKTCKHLGVIKKLKDAIIAAYRIPAVEAL